MNDCRKSRRIWTVWAGIAVVLAARSAGAGSVTLMSPAAYPIVVQEMGNGASLGPLAGPPAPPGPVSADGRWVAFASTATNLVPGQSDTANSSDVFLRDRASGTTVLVSHAPGSTVTAAGGASDQPAVSADGRWVVFQSTATSLVAGQTDTNSALDVFLYDRTTGAVTLVSRAAGFTAKTATGASDRAVISADGTVVAFRSTATNAVGGQVDSNAAADLFRFDVASGTAVLVSHTAASALTAGNGAADTPALSADGAWLAWAGRATNAVSGQSDSNFTWDVFLYNSATGANLLVSRNGTSAVTASNNTSDQPAISADGNWVAFRTAGSNLGVSDVNANTDVWMYSRASGTNLLVSRRVLTPIRTSNSASGNPALSADGAFVAYTSYSSDLVPGQIDPGGQLDVFVFDRAALTHLLASHTAASPVTATSVVSSLPAISADGAWVAYLSDATNLVAGQTDANNAQATRSDLFLWERATQANTLASRSTASPTTTGNKSADRAMLASGGTVAVYASAATDLTAGFTDANNAADVFAWDRVAAANTPVSARDFGPPPATGAGDSRLPGLNPAPPTVSADGRYAVFRSTARNLIAGGTDTNATEDVFLWDRDTASLTLVSHAAGAPATAGNGYSGTPTISADGRWVAFVSQATNLISGFVPNGSGEHVFLWDRTTDATTLVSHAAGSSLAAANGSSRSPVLSSDGGYVVFITGSATDLIAGLSDANGADDVYLYDAATGASTLVSAASGSATTAANGRSYDARLSADGGWVTFVSLARNLVSGITDTASFTDVFLWERATAAQTLVSRSVVLAGRPGSSYSFHPELSADGRWIAYGSSSTDLVAGQVEPGGGTSNDVFLYDRTTGANRLVSHTAGSPATAANGASDDSVLSGDGRFVAFRSEATDFLAGDANGTTDVYRWDRDTDTTILVSRAAGAGPLAAANSSSSQPGISGDGRFVAFFSQATDLVSGQVDPSVNNDVFLFDAAAGAVELVSRDAASPLTAGNGLSSFLLSLSADGSSLAFSSQSSNLVAGDSNGFWDSFLFTLP